jgi:hypothetical protein
MFEGPDKKLENFSDLKNAISLQLSAANSQLGKTK